MWKTAVNKSIREVRFVLKQGPAHHGVWNYVLNKLPEIRMLNQNTFFQISEIPDVMQSPSACYFVYGDVFTTEHEVLSEGLTSDQFQEIFKQKIAFGATLERADEPLINNTFRELPFSVVEAHEHVQYFDDGF